MRPIGRKLLLAFAALSLVFAAVALAKPQKLDVNVRGDSDAELQMKLSKRQGVPTKMTGVSASNILVDEGTLCEPTTVSHNWGTIEIQPSIVQPGRYTFTASETGELGLTYQINGTANTPSAKWQGSFKAFINSGPTQCSSGDISYSARKRN